MSQSIIDNEVRLFRRRYQVAKRAIDIAVCVALLPIAFPIMGICAVLIWLEDGGPVLFRQKRTGLGGRRFEMLKFRTMVKNAEELKHKYADLNELTWPDFKITNDPRVLRIGAFLRKTSLDELPQILNVLRGDMSLVGPRPTSFHWNTYTLDQCERLEVIPGVTGLWQISGRSDIDFDERIRLDVEYIRRRSIAFDLKILVMTFVVIFTRRGAY